MLRSSNLSAHTTSVRNVLRLLAKILVIKPVRFLSFPSVGIDTFVLYDYDSNYIAAVGIPSSSKE